MSPRQKSPSRRPRLIFYIIGFIVAIIIVAGSILATRQAGFSLTTFRSGLGQAISHLGGVNLIVTIDRTILPADGQSQATIIVTPVNTQAKVTASIIQGDGRIQREEATDTKVHFTYTAGDKTGDVSILIKAGAITHRVNIKLAYAAQPAPPVMTAPTDGSEIHESQPEVAGSGLPNTKIVITNNGAPNTTTTTDAKGHFQARIEKPLYNGQHTLAATAVSELGITSSISNLITITVITDPTRLDKDNIRIVPETVTVGASFAVFIPASLNAARVAIEIAGQTHELFDYSGSSVFAATLPAPEQPGIYFGDIILTDSAGNTTRFERLIRLTVISALN